MTIRRVTVTGVAMLAMLSEESSRQTVSAAGSRRSPAGLATPALLPAIPAGSAESVPVHAPPCPPAAPAARPCLPRPLRAEPVLGRLPGLGRLVRQFTFAGE